MRLTDGARAVWARTRSLTPPSWLGPFGREPWIVLGPLILVLLHYSTVISRLSDQNVILAQRLALLEERLTRRRESG